MTLNGERGTLATFAEVDEFWKDGCSLQVIFIGFLYIKKNLHTLFLTIFMFICLLFMCVCVFFLNKKQ